jgi:hypothetical protein
MKRLISTLNDKEFLLLDNYFSNEIVKKCLDELICAFQENESIKNVNTDGIVIKTLNGDNLLISCPSSRILYNDTFNYLKEEFDGHIFELQEKNIGISSNLLSGTSDEFRLHFDRNQVTVVIYLNENQNYPLVLYPNIRLDPNEIKKEELFTLDDKTPIRIYPKPNLGIIFYGRRTIHGVVNEEKLTSTYRYSLQFAFDLQNWNYSGQDYYGS